MSSLGTILCFGFFGFMFIGLPILSAIQGQRRKLQYIPPRIGIEGHGIKRGLTAVEAGILMEEPLDKVLTMILFGVVKKAAASVTSRDPLKVQVTDPLPDGLHDYEIGFLNAFKIDDVRARQTALQDMMVALVKSVSEKMKGFSRKETQDYYKNIMEQAWAQVESAQTPEVKGQAIDQNLEWTMLDHDYNDRSRRVFTGPIFIPMWWGQYDPDLSDHAHCRPSTGSMSGPSLGRGSSSLPGADLAASVVGGVQTFSGKVIGDLNTFTSKITNVTNPPPPPSTTVIAAVGAPVVPVLVLVQAAPVPVPVAEDSERFNDTNLQVLMLTCLIKSGKGLIANFESPRLSILNPRAGLYHYQRMNGNEKSRIHLRIDPDGTGTLIVNANSILHLNPSAAYIAWMVLEEKTKSETVRALTARYAVGKRQAEADFSTINFQLSELLRPDGACPIHELGLETSMPFSARPSAPYRMDLAVTYRCNNDCAHCYNGRPRDFFELDTLYWKLILDILWKLGVPHIVFTGGEATLREDLPELIAHAESNGQITGLNTNARRLSDEKYVQRLVEAGLDHVQITVESGDEEIHDLMVGRKGAYRQTIRGLENALSSRLYVMTNTTMLKTNVAKDSGHLGLPCRPRRADHRAERAHLCRPGPHGWNGPR